MKKESKKSLAVEDVRKRCGGAGTFNPTATLKHDVTQSIIKGVFESTDPFFQTMGCVAAQGILRALSNPDIVAVVFRVHGKPLRALDQKRNSQ